MAAAVAIGALAVVAATPLARPIFSAISMPEARPEPQMAVADTTKLRYPIADEGPVPTQAGQERGSSFDLKNPSNAEYDAVYDPTTQTVTIYRKIGGMNIRLPYTMTLQEYQNDAVRRSMLNYWASKSKQRPEGLLAEGEEKQKNTLLNSKWKVNSDLFTSVFGSDQITMRMQGQAKVSLGIQYNRIDNPTLQERMRKTTSFDFDEEVQINLNAQIGERMKFAINYNTEATFDFENEVKLNYEGTEDDIIQNIEAGNINWTLPGTLIQGSQSLFGFKMDMRFGNLDVSTVFSQKRGESQSITVQNGSTSQEFDIDITDYEKNKHFFLSHRFKENYDQSLSALPTVTSGVTITKVEVWITNKTGVYTNARNVVAFVDLGETGDNISDQALWRGADGAYPDNSANNLYGEMTGTHSAIRSINSVTSELQGLTDFKNGRDYEKIENARLLSPSEYTINDKLGYISLNTALNNNEVLAVAYQYTYRGRTYQVGEFSNDGVAAPNTLILKLLKGTTLTPKYKNWSLMMKNIYSLGSYDIESKDFDLNVVYCNDSSSTYINYLNEGKKPMYGGHNGETYLQILNCDRLDANNDVSADGKYDFVNGYTINASKGRVIFPEREPFGSYLAEKLKGEPALAKKYAFTALYDSTQVYAKQQTQKNKFKIRGKYQSSSSSEISLNAFNLAQGSVIVTAGGQVLAENVDYSVDYSLGRVKILNQSLLNSGTAINISFENESAISTETQTLVGAHLNYKFSDNFNLGATIIHMNEKPLTNKVSYGDESVSNTMLGLDMNYKHDLPWLTSAIDALPLVSTDAMSSITFEGEVAKLIPGHARSINAAYIDDFEGSSVSYDIKAWTAWKLASKPQGQSALFPKADLTNDISVGFDRARLAWYYIDPLFLRNLTTTPNHIKNDADQQSSHYVREVYEEELYPNKESAYGESTNISVLNLAYYPAERGPYNFTTDLTKDGFLANPEDSWAGIQRKLETTDFETNNVEYIEFWMLDPFIYNKDVNAGGDLYFNVGYVSEDVLKDGRKGFENGLPTPSEEFVVDTTSWGYVPTTNALVNGFNTDPASMRAQDAGLNGMSSERERNFYNSADYPYITYIKQMYAAGELTQDAYDAIMEDPAADDYHYYRGSDYDNEKTSILDRYKRFNNTEGNSCPTEYSPETYSTAAYSTPDNEDMNSDYTLSETENYYQYHISIRPDSMVVGHNCIADMMTTTVKLKNGNTESVNWYQFKIPLAEPDDVIGDITDMSSMQFMRMIMKNFADTCILRFATLELVKGEWRKYSDDLYEDDANPSGATVFTTSTINIEENDRRTPVNYVLPPGIDRTVDPSNPQLRQLNEQAYSLNVVDLGNGDARAVYKTINLDVRNYKRLRMYIHAEAIDGYPLEDDQMSAFIRLGSDYEDNYYEYEIPLELTPHGTYSDNNETDRYAVWPEDNELNVPLSLFTECKLARNAAKREAGSTITLQTVYSMADPDKLNNRVRIKGNPTLGEVQVMMVGLRARGAGTKSCEVWINELRLTDFDEAGGWAARGRTNVQLADLGSIAASGQYASVGFGSIDQSVSERSIDEDMQFDVSTSLELGKFLGPESRLSMPFYASYSKSVQTPKYSPYDSDVLLKTVLNTAKSKHERDSIKAMSQTTETIKSINVSNMRLKPKKGERATPISPSNLSFTYAYTTTLKTDPDTERDLSRQHNGVIAYNYQSAAKPIEPFKKSSLNAKYFGLLKDFSIYKGPSLLAYRWEIARDYQEVQNRNVSNPEYVVPLSVSKNFDWNRYLDFRYNLTKNLKFTLSASNIATIDEPDGPVNKDLYPEEYKAWRDSVWSQISKFGRPTDYQHTATLDWTIPVNKLPYLEFMSATAQYKAQYIWKAGYQGTEYDWGNTIMNRNTKQLNVMGNFITLYNKSKTLKDLYNTYNFSSSNKKSQQRQNNGGQTVRYSQNNMVMEPGKAITITHKLNTTDVQIKAFDEKGRGVKGVFVAKDKNTAVFTPTQKAAKGRVVITGVVKDDKSIADRFRDIALITVTSLKNISISYSENNSTTLPGYLPTAHLAGASQEPGGLAPGLPFMMGWQDKDFAYKAINHNWITTDTTLSEPYLMSHSTSLQIRASFEMFKALKVDLTASRTHDKSMEEYYVFNEAGFDGVYNHIENGSFNMSYNIIHTAFKSVSKTGSLSSATYNKFLASRQAIADRCAANRAARSASYTGLDAVDTEGQSLNGRDGYSLTSQEVLIPAFLSAYSGSSTSKIFMNFIPKWTAMKPNWKVTFSGLSNIDKLKDIARNIELQHGYTAKYQVGSYTTNIEWEQAGDGLSYIRDLSNNFLPQYTVSTVTLAEQFSPLFSVSATLINNITASIANNRTRQIALSLANNQITETYSKEWTLSVGYRFDKLNLIFGKGENQKSVNNDINMTFAVSQRDNFTILRRIEEGTNELASGTKTTSIKFSADYAFTQRFSMEFYYDQSIAKPYVSSSYPTNNINVGVSFQLSLTQ